MSAFLNIENDTWAKYASCIFEGEELFCFVCKREWNPVPGHTPPSEFIFEIRHEDKYYAAGSTYEEAVSNFAYTIWVKQYNKLI